MGWQVGTVTEFREATWTAPFRQWPERSCEAGARRVWRAGGRAQPLQGQSVTAGAAFQQR